MATNDDPRQLPRGRDGRREEGRRLFGPPSRRLMPDGPAAVTPVWSTVVGDTIRRQHSARRGGGRQKDKTAERKRRGRPCRFTDPGEPLQGTSAQFEGRIIRGGPRKAPGRRNIGALLPRKVTWTRISTRFVARGEVARDLRDSSRPSLSVDGLTVAGARRTPSGRSAALQGGGAALRGRNGGFALASTERTSCSRPRLGRRRRRLRDRAFGRGGSRS